jgi:hypothetical protein
MNKNIIFYRKKFLLKIVLITLVSSLVILAIWCYKHTKHDLDMAQDAKQGFDLASYNFDICNHQGLRPVWLVTYGAGSVYQANQKALVISSVDKCIDTVKIYTPELLGSNFLEKNKAIMDQKRGAGYWLWKPYIILETLKQTPENDIVIYIDSGLVVKKPLDSLIKQLGEFDMMAFNNSHTNLPYTKNDLFTQMDMDSEYARNHIQYDGSVIIMRSNKNTREFVEKWLKWCENEHAITDSPSKSAERVEFVDHRHDQSILSLLLLKSKSEIKFLALPLELKDKFFHHHRRRLINESLVILKKQ